jgi:hypothetical protein
MLPTDTEMLKAFFDKSVPFKTRSEGSTIPEGYSMTPSKLSVYWQFREGDRIAILRMSYWVEEKGKGKTT